MNAESMFIFMTSFMSVGVLLALGINALIFDVDRKGRTKDQDRR